MSSLSSKKEILQTIIRKKVIIENNYFNISKIIEEIIANADDDNTIKIAQNKQYALDNAINFAISELELLVKAFIDSIQSNDSEKFKQIEKEMQQKIDELNLKTQELTADLSKVVESDKSIENSHYGALDQTIYQEQEVEKNFGKKSRNEINDLRQGVLVESLNDYSPREASAFADMYFDEVASYNEYKENKDAVNNAVEIKSEFKSMDDYTVDQQLLDIEKRLMDEINSIKTSNQIILDSNDTLMSKINKKNKEILDTQIIDTGSFNMLDVAINDMISKIELAQLSDFRNQNIKNLEDISSTLVKSLESNIQSLSKDVAELKTENTEYRMKIENYINTINDLKNESMLKEQELNESYSAWVLSNKKLQDLELLLGQQSVDLSDLDGQKNVIIDSLEKKLKETIDNLNTVLIQNEELISKQEELEEFIRVNNINTDYPQSAFDADIESTSIQDLVESEANRIVDTKLTAMLSRYKEELDFLENRVKENISGANAHKDLLSNEIEKQLEEESYIKKLENTIKKFESKINKLENKIKESEINDAKTKQTIESLNELLEFDQIKEDVMDSEVGQKLKSLEKMITDTAYRLDAQRLGVTPIERVNDVQNLSNDELEKLITNSDLYNSVRTEIMRLENQVSALKTENIKIKKENFEINTELDDSIQKFVYNSNKMREVENLLNYQLNEQEKLNSEKDELIYALEEKVNNSYYKTSNEMIDEMKTYEEELYSIDKWDENNMDAVNESQNNEFMIRENIELLIDKRVNELLADKALGILSKQMDDQYYKNEFHDSLITDELDNSVNNEDNNAIKKEQKINKSNSNYKDVSLPISQSFGSKDFVEESYSFDENNNENNQETVFDNNLDNEKLESKNNNILSTNDYEKQNLEEQLELLQRENELLQNQLIESEVKEKIIIKEVIKDRAKLPDELVENTERLKNFEKLLIQIDNEISNLENDSLNKFINNEF